MGVDCEPFGLGVDKINVVPSEADPALQLPLNVVMFTTESLLLMDTELGANGKDSIVVTNESQFNQLLKQCLLNMEAPLQSYINEDMEVEDLDLIPTLEDWMIV
ncbi:hypothetical protein HDU79_009067, partial [Rhizoclosmatium sp. JEL0117]